MLNQTSIVVFYAENDGGVHFDQKFVSGSVGASKVKSQGRPQDFFRGGPDFFRRWAI